MPIDEAHRRDRKPGKRLEHARHDVPLQKAGGDAKGALYAKGQGKQWAIVGFERPRLDCE